MPAVEEDPVAQAAKMAISMHGAGGEGSEEIEGAFQNAEMRAFYEQLPDLRSMLPAVLFGDEAPRDEDALETTKFEELLRALPLVENKHDADEARQIRTRLLP